MNLTTFRKLAKNRRIHWLPEYVSDGVYMVPIAMFGKDAHWFATPEQTKAACKVSDLDFGDATKIPDLKSCLENYLVPCENDAPIAKWTPITVNTQTAGLARLYLADTYAAAFADDRIQAIGNPQELKCKKVSEHPEDLPHMSIDGCLIMPLRIASILTDSLRTTLGRFSVTPPYHE